MREMIQKFMLISGAGGLVLYRKSFIDRQVEREDGGLLAGLLTALVTATKKSLGLAMLHLRFENVAVNVVDVVVDQRRNQSERLICFLYTDVDDDERFGRLMASELLNAFVDKYAENLSEMRTGTNENFEVQFHDFSSKVYAVIENSVVPVMKDLERQNGLKHVILLKQNGGLQEDLLHSVWYPDNIDNQTGILAEVQNFLNVADDILSHKQCKTVTARIGDRIGITRLRRATLIVVCRSSDAYIQCQPRIKSSIQLLDRIFNVLGSLKS